MARSLNETLRKYCRPDGRKGFAQDLAQTLGIALATLALFMV